MLRKRGQSASIDLQSTACRIFDDFNPTAKDLETWRRIQIFEDESQVPTNRVSQESYVNKPVVSMLPVDDRIES